ncbi:MAG: tyrosine-type recombinase/integrase [Bacteroidetes bacterium]|nr:tyrosine-type recombinase/integrase [Bacteroidota bacterium]
MHIKSFLEYLRSEKRYSPHTVTAYHNDLLQFFEFIEIHYETNDPAIVSQHMIRSWISYLMDHSISSRTINRKLSTLKTFYRFLRKQDLVKTSPLLKINPPKTNKRLPEFVNEDKMDLLLDENVFEEDFKGTRNRLIIELLYNTGMRLSELTNIQHADINFPKHELKVVGKRNKERLIPFNKTLKEMLETYMRERKKEFGSTTECSYLLLTDNGKKIYKKLVYRIVNSYLSQVSTLKKKSPHVLRHTFATHMLNNGADLNAIKEILGHANLAATQVYTHNTIENLKKVYKQAHPRA